MSCSQLCRLPIRRTILLGCCMGLIAAPWLPQASASLVVSGTVDGLDVAAEAEFSIDSGNPDLLVLTLKNTLATPMTGRGQTLVGLLFSVDGADPSLTLSSAAGTVDYDGNSDASPGTANTNLLTTDIGNGQGPPHWELASNPGGELSSAATFEYGLSSIGGSASGYTGIWDGGNLDGDPWGIVSASTNVDSPPFTTGGPTIKPRWVRESATFVFSGFSGLSLSQIDPTVQFMFGSVPNGTINASSVPEPAAGVLLLVGVLATFIRRQRAAVSR